METGIFVNSTKKEDEAKSLLNPKNNCYIYTFTQLLQFFSTCIKVRLWRSWGDL